MQRHTALYPTLLLSLFLAGCKVGPDFHAPDAHAPSHWLTNVAQDDKAQVQQQWWSNFNDPLLNQLIAKALSDNLDLKISDARIAEARATRANAKADLSPVINTTASAEREGNRVAFGNVPFDIAKPFNTFQVGFDASWELDLFGGKKREVESATAELKAAEATRDDARVSMLAEVARTYVDIRRYQAQIEVTKNILASDQKTLSIAQERFKAGTNPRLDSIQAESQVQQAESLLPNYQSALISSELSMDVLLGEKPGYTQNLLTTTQPIPVSSASLVLAAPASVIANRPDIRVAGYHLASATAERGVADAQLYPDVSLSGFLGLLSPDSNTLFKSNSKSWDFGGNILWPILNFQKLSANIDMSNAREHEALLTYQKSVLSALSDVERSVTTLTHDQEHLGAMTKEVADNLHAADIAHARYKQGITSFLEVLDAERTLYASQNALTDANAAVTIDLIAVYKSLGGGWKNDSAKTQANQ